MNVPNQLTVARFVLGLSGAAALALPVLPFRFSIAVTLFVAAAISDYADGIIARRYGLISPFGAFMDSLADKVLVFLFFVALHHFGLYPLGLVLAILARDLLNDGLRSYLVGQGVVMSANRFSKWKAALQMVSITLGLLTFVFLEWGIALPANAHIGMLLATEVLMFAALLFGLIGMWQYLRGHVSTLLRNT